MSESITWNGQSFTVPDPGDTGWGQNLTNYLVALPSGALQKTGGAFTLTADTNFGATFGLVSKYFTSRTANAAAAGAVRLAVGDTVSFRNNANNADLTIGVDGSNNLTFGGTKVIISGQIVNADIANAAGIVYSKLNLSASVVNADIAAAAAIAHNKMAALNVSIVPVTDASGFLVSSATTVTELGYVHGVTSDIQTQFTGKAATNLSNVSAVSADVPLNSHKITGLANGTASTDAAAFGQMLFVQAVTTQAVTATSTTSASFTDATNMTVTITPKSSSNKILIQVYGFIEFGATAAGQNAAYTVLRGASNLGDASSGVFTVTSQANATIGYPFSWTYLDSPATTTATTYKVQFKSDGTRTAYWNRLGIAGAGFIRVSEVIQ